MFISALINVAFLWDFGLIFLLYKSHIGYMCTFLFILLLTKLIKPLPHLIREPKDIGYFFLGILFGWYHGYVKLYALYTFKNAKWLGRPNLIGDSSTPMDRIIAPHNTEVASKNDIASNDGPSNNDDTAPGGDSSADYIISQIIDHPQSSKPPGSQPPKSHIPRTHKEPSPTAHNSQTPTVQKSASPTMSLKKI